jgi:uncharacterized protein YjiS (DUF1127 family)
MLHCTKRIGAMQHPSLQKRLVRGYLPLIARTTKHDETLIGNEMNLIRNYRNWRRYRETVTELSRLSNRELNDLGIARGDIPFVARKSV